MRDDLKNERGFSMIKLLFWLAVLAVTVVAGYKVIPIYNAEWKIQGAFDSVAKNMTDRSERDIRKRLPELLRMNYLAEGDVPDEFYDNIVIHVEAGGVEIYSEYRVTLWFLGPVEGVDPDDYEESELQGMDKIRHKARHDFDFEPYAETP